MSLQEISAIIYILTGEHSFHNLRAFEIRPNLFPIEKRDDPLHGGFEALKVFGRDISFASFFLPS